MPDLLRRIFFRRRRSLEDIGLSAQKIRQIAYHECGHVLVTHLCGDGEALESANIIPSDAGYGQVRKKPDPHFMQASTRSELENAIVVKLAGRAAEEIVFGKGEISTGCSHDLAAATMIATKMVAYWGFSDKLGLISLDMKTAADIPEVRSEAAKILEKQYVRALRLIDESRHALDDLAARLITDRFLSAEDIHQTLEKSAGLQRNQLR
jgi:cell division protease FtsH